MTNKYILSGTALFAVVALVFAIDAAFAVPEITEAELQDVLGNKIHDLERTNEALAKLRSNEEVRGSIASNEAKIASLSEQYYALSPQRDLEEISDERRAELTTSMWKLASTDYPFLSMGINPYTGEIDIKLDDALASDVDEELQSIVGDGVSLNISYGQNDATFQGSCPSQTGKCATIIGASKGEPDNNLDVDCTINIVATKGQGSTQVKGVVIPHHCNESHDDYYQYSKNISSHMVGPHYTDGGWWCDCDFVEIDTRASSIGKVNDGGSDISVSYGDLSENNAVYMIGQHSGKDHGTIVKTNQWVVIQGTWYTDVYFVKNISFDGGDSGAPIIRDSDERYGGMNIGAGTEYIDGEYITVNYVHDWTFLKSKLGLN